MADSFGAGADGAKGRWESDLMLPESTPKGARLEPDRKNAHRGPGGGLQGLLS